MNCLIIRKPADWEVVTSSLKALSRGKAKEVRYIADIEDLTGEPFLVEVVVMSTRGQADYVLEIWGPPLSDLADDTVGMCLAIALGQPVIIGGSSLDPYIWVLLHPDGRITNIELDIEQLDEASVVRYREA